MCSLRGPATFSLYYPWLYLRQSRVWLCKNFSFWIFIHSLNLAQSWWLYSNMHAYFHPCYSHCNLRFIQVWGCPYWVIYLHFSHVYHFLDSLVRNWSDYVLGKFESIGNMQRRSPNLHVCYADLYYIDRVCKLFFWRFLKLIIEEGLTA